MGINSIKYPSKVKQVRLINNAENLHEDLLLEFSTSANNFIPNLEKRKVDQERSKFIRQQIHEEEAKFEDQEYL